MKKVDQANPFGLEQYMADIPSENIVYLPRYKNCDHKENLSCLVNGNFKPRFYCWDCNSVWSGEITKEGMKWELLNEKAD